MTKTLTLNLTEKEMEVLDELANKKGMSKTAILKQALRLYQSVEVRLEKGEKVFSENEKKDKVELVLL
jgi:predicted transcriptional regulator